MATIKLTHCADVQIKARNKFENILLNASKKTLREIEEKVEKSGSTVHVISGDLFEYPVPNENERKLIYEHLLNLVKIESLKEIIIIAGNHDLIKNHRKEAIVESRNNNALDLIEFVAKKVNSNKLRYFKNSGIYESNAGNFKYVVYSLEDTNDYKDKVAWEKIKNEANQLNEFTFTLYHAMLRNYAEMDNIPLSQSALSNLICLDDFHNNTLILAGDIHKQLVFGNSKNDSQIFVYPGSTMQHTFGEGDYYTVGIDDYKVDTIVKPKHLCQYKFDDVTKKYTMLQPIELTDYVKYHTISIDSQVDFEIAKHWLTTIRDKYLVNNMDQVYHVVKLKMNSNLSEFEFKLRKLFENTNVSLVFDYAKIEIKNTYSENKAVQEIIEQKGDVSDFIDSSNIDDLYLNDEQLQKLFDNCLAATIDNVSDKLPDGVAENIKQLFAEQLMEAVKANAGRHNIRLNWISTDGFMLLGKSQLNFEDGLTQITGTNGVGKTTIFRMIRWALTGVPFEGMSAHKNIRNYLVFNNNLPDRNEVTINLCFNVGEKTYNIKRWVTRTWKQNITNEQKLSANWQDYISKINSELRLFENESNSQWEGAVAQKMIDSAFANIIDTIMFVDHTKLKNILNMQPEVLNNTIMEYAGITYLTALENNLDYVKSELLSVSKPKRSSEDIFEDIVDCKAHIKEKVAQYDSKIDAQDKLNAELTELKSDKNKIIDKLISIGDIAGKIDSIKTSLNDIDIKISETPIKMLQPLPTFDLEKPEMDDEKLSLMEGEKNDFQFKINMNEKELKSYLENQTELKDKFSEIYHDYQKQISQKTADISLQINKCRDNLSNQFSFVSNSLQDTIIKLNNKVHEIKTEIITKQQTRHHLDIEFKNVEKEIADGVCKSCGRPFTDNVEEHEKHIEILKNKIQKINGDIVQIHCEIQEQKTKIEAAENLLNKYQKAYDKIKSNHLDECYTVFENEEFSTIKVITSSKEKIDNLFNEFNELSEKQNQVIKEQKECYETAHKEGWDEHSKKLLEDIANIELTIDTHNQRLENLKSKYNDYCKHIDNYKQEFYEKMNAYQEQKIKFQDYFNQICKENDNIVLQNEENKKLNEARINLQKILVDNESKLHEFNNLQLEKDTIQNRIESNETLINELKNEAQAILLGKNTYENKLEILSKEEENYNEYVRNNAVWKIYSKLIKTTFKNVVFDYYRVYLNNTLNELLSDLHFKLYWNNESLLTMVSQKNGVMYNQPVIGASGMESTFLGLSLIYTLHLLNVKNKINTIFIDELSGTLNKGNNLSYVANDYQELFAKILAKMKQKSIYIVDHNVENLNEDRCIEIVPNESKTESCLN